MVRDNWAHKAAITLSGDEHGLWVLTISAINASRNLAAELRTEPVRAVPDKRQLIRPIPSGESLEQFLAKLPDLWRQDAARTSRERRVQPPRTWRTRPDPFEGVWCDVLSWLQEDPDASAVALLGRLQEAEPDRSSRAHLRTLQRRVRQWRGIMAKKLVYATAGEPMAEPPAMPELALVGVDSRC